MAKMFILLPILCLVYAFGQMNDDITKESLGERLFFDPILSVDSTVSCSSCHKRHLAFADSVAISPGVYGRIGTRNAPSIMNTASRSHLFFDGRATSLEDQVHFPIEDFHEMGLTMDEAVSRLQRHPQYSKWFFYLYKTSVDRKNLADAIAAFEASLETSDTEFDAWMNDLPNQFSEAAERGRTLFMGPKAKCFDCHFSPDFTGDEFKNIGLYDGEKYMDKGRYLITKDSNDLGKFKVPGLRNVAVTAPYMHDGSFKTLESVIDYYSNPYEFVHKPMNIDTSLVQPLLLTASEKSDLIAFLYSLTDRQFYGILQKKGINSIK